MPFQYEATLRHHDMMLLAFMLADQHRPRHQLALTGKGHGCIAITARSVSCEPVEQLTGHWRQIAERLRLQAICQQAQEQGLGKMCWRRAAENGAPAQLQGGEIEAAQALDLGFDVVRILHGRWLNVQSRSGARRP